MYRYLTLFSALSPSQEQSNILQSRNSHGAKAEECRVYPGVWGFWTLAMRYYTAESLRTSSIARCIQRIECS
ncbi:hypothetical protein C8R41DRAFT_839205 [Lentinula lateritia]|uniref:Uncharacterized protein n=1 Tax=Lentinula lateritia TaxID=40482 RepID=A0ABQ8VGA5_9AGAR|nr:hypothetical protein C8R41DRAFT_839205 [Lentinula lateritia]